jgi:hypothetical protein
MSHLIIAGLLLGVCLFQVDYFAYCQLLIAYLKLISQLTVSSASAIDQECGFFLPVNLR